MRPKTVVGGLEEGLLETTYTPERPGRGTHRQKADGRKAKQQEGRHRKHAGRAGAREPQGPGARIQGMPAGKQKHLCG